MPVLPGSPPSLKRRKQQGWRAVPFAASSPGPSQVSCDWSRSLRPPGILSTIGRKGWRSRWKVALYWCRFSKGAGLSTPEEEGKLFPFHVVAAGGAEDRMAMAESANRASEAADSGDIVESDLPAALSLLKSLQEQVVAVTRHVQGLAQKVRSGAYTTEKGLSFLEVKDQLLLLYLQDLTLLILEKISGRSLAGHPALLRLVETRTVLEKMRPVDQKLKYQVDKLVKAAITGALGENDPLRFRPNPGNMMSKLSESEESEDEGTADGKKTSGASKGGGRKYIPPRLVPVYYDETEAEREKKILEQAKKRALSSSIIRELKEQYSDAPEEVREGRYAHASRQSREDEHRTSYEESMMVRLNVSRKEKARRRRAGALTSQLSSLTHFGDISALTGATGVAEEDLGPQKKIKKKVGIKKGKKKKGFHKRR